MAHFTHKTKHVFFFVLLKSWSHYVTPTHKNALFLGELLQIYHKFGVFDPIQKKKVMNAYLRCVFLKLCG